MAIRKRPEIEKHHYLATELNRMLDSHDPALTARDLSNMIGISTQAINRVLKQNIGTFAEATLENIVEAFALSQDTLEFLIHLRYLDMFEEHFGGQLTIDKTSIPAEMSFEWEQLDKEQRAQVRTMIYDFVQENLSKKKKPVKQR